jgi:hypothetical protein
MAENEQTLTNTGKLASSTTRHTISTYFTVLVIIFIRTFCVRAYLFEL